MTAYTDDDVAMVAGEFCHDEVSAPCRTCLSLARQALDDVAPAIAARALRQAADEVAAFGQYGGPLTDIGVWSNVERWLRARAEQVTSDE